jgi:hypothetical protein
VQETPVKLSAARTVTQVWSLVDSAIDEEELFGAI